MKSKVLLVYLPGVEIGYGPIFPLGLGYLLATLQKERATKAVHFEKFETAINRLPDIMASFKPTVVGLTCSTFNRGRVRRVINWLKVYYPDVKIVVGGVHASFYPEQMIQNYGADFVVIGEGEETITQLCRAIDENAPLDWINGIAYKLGKSVVCTKPREPIPCLDSLPIPDYSYAGNMMKNSGLGFVFTSRGCPARCTFCSTTAYWGQKVRTHSPKRIVDEIEILIEKYGTRKILFHDDTFNLTVNKVTGICDEIISRKVDITWAASCRVHPVSQEMIDKMVEAGCRHICWGIESGSAEMLARINKKITQEQIKTAYEMCRKHIGTISVGAFAMVGNPGESEKTIQESVNFINTLPMTDSPGAAVLYILPGTKVYEDIKKKEPSIDLFWLTNDDGVMRPQEYSIIRLQQWAMRVAASGNRIPFDRSKHFFNNVLFGNLPLPAEEDL